MISLFDQNNHELPLFRHFIDAEGDTTFDRRGKSRTAALYYLLQEERVNATWRPQDLRYSDDFEGTVHSVLPAYPHTRALDRIFQHQEAIRKTALKLRQQAEKDKIDARMAIVPEVPAGFESWVRDVLMADQQFVFYYYDRKGQHQGACSVCGYEGIFPDARRGAKGACPSCGCAITYLPQLASKSVHARKHVAIFQKVDDALILRAFTIDCNNGRTDARFRRRLFSFHEWYRRLYLLPEATHREYEFGKWKQTEELRWCRFNASRYSPSWMHVYPEGVSEALAGTPWQFSRLEELAKGLELSESWDVIRFLGVFPSHKSIEFVIRAGLYEYLRHVFSWGWVREDDLKILPKLTREEIAILRETQGTPHHARMLAEARKHGIRLSGEEVRDVVSIAHEDTRVVQVLKETTVPKLMEYLKDQKRSDSLSALYNFYYDYFRAAKELREYFHQPFVLFPEDLRTAHDQANDEKNRLAELLRKKKFEEWSARLGAKHEDLARLYGFEADGYSIRVPRSREELKAEGEAMKNCIATYLEDMANDKTVVLFLRKAENPDEPFVDIEVRDGMVRQCRRKCNQDATKELRAFLDKFAAEKRLRVSV